MVQTKLVDGVSFITIKNNKGLKIVFSSLGASVFAIYFDDTLMTLSLAKEKDYFDPDLYHGKTIGPVCGRILGGQIGERHYVMNEYNVARHGGVHGLSTKIFDYEIVEKVDTVSLIFTYQGFEVEYSVDVNEDSFTIEYRYKGENQPISLTNHTFFHLGGSFKDLYLSINADSFVESDTFSLVPSRKKDIISCLDFHKEKLLSQDVNDSYLMDSRTKGYDHYLHFAKEKQLYLRNNKYQLNIQTDFTGVHIYSDNYAFDEQTIDSRYGIRKALAVEPQDSPLERKNYSDNYSRFIKYSFKKL